MHEGDGRSVRHSAVMVRRYWQTTHLPAPPRCAQVLNAYADQLSQGQRPQPAGLEFYVRDKHGSFVSVAAELPPHGSLAPLFYAFGLITLEEAQRQSAAGDLLGNERDLFEWLSGVAADAARTADQHDALKRALRALRTNLEEEYGLAAVDAGGDFAMGSELQKRQLEALRILQSGLSALADADSEAEEGRVAAFEGLRLRLYHWDDAPLTSVGYQDSDGTFHMRTEPMKSHVADDGTIQVVADPLHIEAALKSLDLERAGLLARVSAFWVRRSRDLSVALKDELHVENVWCDTRSDDAAQRFVLWAGSLLERRADVQLAVGRRRYSFSLLVHDDPASPMLDFVPSGSMLQVRTDCPPKQLLAFMSSEAGTLAHETAAQVAGSRAEEDDTLNAVREALGAKQVVRVCSSHDQAKVLEAARRLIEAAPSLRATLDLSNVSLAIDDCYDVWDSGFVSIPFDFALSDLQPQLRALLAPPELTAATRDGGGNGTRAMAQVGDALRRAALAPKAVFMSPCHGGRLMGGRRLQPPRSALLRACLQRSSVLGARRTHTRASGAPLHHPPSSL